MPMINIAVVEDDTAYRQQLIAHIATTKDDADSYGFGVENIRRTVESYGGSLLFETADDRFLLTAMAPIAA